MFLKSLLSAALLISGVAFAQTAEQTSTAELSLDSYIVPSHQPEHYRLGLIIPNLRETTKSYMGGSQSNTMDRAAIGVSFSKTNMPLNDFGWTAGAALMQIDSQGYLVDEGGDGVPYYMYSAKPTENIARIEGNMAYAFHPKLHAKGGFNFIRGLQATSSRRRFVPGTQISIGYQASNLIGVDIGYVQMNSKDEFGASSRLAGVELVAIAQF
jgi:hypothetical protein